MAGSGKVFGSSGECSSLASMVGMCFQLLEAADSKGKSLLSQLSGSTRDSAYEEAQEVVGEVASIISGATEPMEKVQKALNEYAAFLESMGK